MMREPAIIRTQNHRETMDFTEKKAREAVEAQGKSEVAERCGQGHYEGLYSRGPYFWEFVDTAGGIAPKKAAWFTIELEFDDGGIDFTLYDGDREDMEEVAYVLGTGRVNDLSEGAGRIAVQQAFRLIDAVRMNQIHNE